MNSVIQFPKIMRGGFRHKPYQSPSFEDSVKKPGLTSIQQDSAIQSPKIMRGAFRHKPYQSPSYEDSVKKPRLTSIQQATTCPETVCLDVKDFPHLHYLYTMTRDFYLRAQNSVNIPHSVYISQEEPVIQMTLDGDWNLEKLQMFKIDASCSSVARELSKPVWPSSPILYYQFETQSVPEILKTFRKEHMQSTCSTRVIVIVSPSVNVMPKFIEDGKNLRFVIVQDSKQLRDILTHVLEIPLSDYLKEANKMLREGKRNEDLEKSSTEWLLEEIRTLQSMIKKTSENDPMEKKTDPVIPLSLTNYLYRKRNVIAFGIWRRKQFRVFVKDMSQTRQLEHRIQYFGGDFFKKVELVFISDSMNFKIQMKQGDKLYTHISTKSALSHHPATSSSVEEHYGTLGAFVKSSCTSSALALTCGHVYPPNEAGNTAYSRPTEDSDPCRIGTCIFSTLTGNGKFIDFAVIEIDNEMKDKCDMVLRNAMGSRCRTILYTEESLPNEDMVHKKGAKTQLTCGKIEYSQYHSKLFQGRKEVFLVSGFGKKFSQPGDSGSVVFCHNRSSEQNCIYAVGMVSHGEIDDREDSNSSKDPGLSVCFRLSDAFSTLEEAMPQLKPSFVEFDE